MLVALIAVSGCASGSLKPFASSDVSNLERWVDAELAPYLVEQLSQQPRFKGEPVVLVRIQGEDVQPRVDGLTGRIRDRLTARLISSPGIHLPWRPGRTLPRHHRRAVDSDCRSREQVQYYIGIELVDEGERRLRISVRVLDLSDGEWVSGFGQTWRGRMTREEARALAHDRIDESLRGLRLLPFDGAQPDLAAAYLANNLVCLLRQRGVGEARIYVDQANPGPSEARPVFALLGNYLSRFPGIEISDRKAAAELVLRGEAHRIDGRLLQLWAVLRAPAEEQHLSGVDTLVYVAETSGAPARIGGERGGDDRQEESTLRRVSRTASRETGPPPVIEEFRLVTPRAPELCASPDPWASGRRVLSQPGSLPRSGCFAFEYAIRGANRLFVLDHTQTGSLWRIDGSDCGLDRGNGTGGRSHLLYADALPGSETLYAIAVGDPALARRLDAHLRQVPSRCGVPPDRNSVAPVPDRWLAQLDALIEDNPGRVAWVTLRLSHAP